MPGSALSVIIVNYRSPALTVRCVRSLIAHGIAAADDIIVVENGSGDDSSAQIRAAETGARVLEVADNRGYGAGLNLGMAETRGELVLCLNPDTYFTGPEATRVPALFAADPALALLGLDLHYPDGDRQYSTRRDYSLLDILLRRTPLGRVGPGRRLVDRHLMKDAWAGEVFTADWVMGTGFVVRRTAFDAVGGMDTDFFLYMEDVDLCLRLRAAGWRVAAAPGIELVHDHQRASGRALFSRAARFHLQSLGVFMRKHHVPLLPPRA